MESFLSDLKAEGDFDSDGNFTIDVSRAQVKLAEYQLARFELFPDFLVETAIAGGAEALNVTINASSKVASGTLTTVRFRGFSLSENELSELSYAGSQRPTSRAVESLSIALSTLSSRYPLTLRSRGTSDSALVARIFRGDITMRSVSGNKHRVNTTSLQIPVDLTPEFTESFRRRSLWSSVRLSINKTAYHSSATLPERLTETEGYLFSSTCPQNFLSVGEREAGHAFVEEGETATPFFLALTDPEQARRMGLSFWLDGSSYSALPELRELGICGFVAVPELRRDLSYSALLNNQAYQTVQQDTRRRIVSLLARRFASDEPLSSKAYSYCHFIIRELERHLEVQELWSGLAECAVDLEPAVDQESWKRLKEQLPKANSDSLTKLWSAFDELVKGFRRIGDLAKAHEFQAQKCECFAMLGIKSPSAIASLTNLQFLVGGYKPDFENLPSGLAEYLGALESWPETPTLELTESLTNQIHSSWLWPFALHEAVFRQNWDWFENIAKDPLPAWAICLRLFQEKRVPEALQILEQTPNLRYTTEPRAWYEYLCHCHSARTNFAQAVRFRVKLSLELVRETGWVRELPERLIPRLLNPIGSASAENLLSRADQCVGKEFFRSRFWPEFFLLCQTSTRYPEWQFQKFVRRLCFQSLLGSLLENPEANPLSRPFLEEIPGAW